MNKLKCTKCNETKEAVDFFFKNKKINKRHAQCKTCYKQSRKNKEHYLKNKSAYLHRAKKRKKRIILENRTNLLEYYKTHACIRCGESNPIVLDFDHRDAKNKKYGISRMLISTFSWNSILTEIGKCDVLCSNCHRIKTSKQFGWWYENIKLAQ